MKRASERELGATRRFLDERHEHDVDGLLDMIYTSITFAVREGSDSPILPSPCPLLLTGQMTGQMVLLHVRICFLAFAIDHLP